MNVFQSQELIKVNKIFIDKEEYNRYLAKQFLALGNSTRVKGDAGGAKKVTTTTTTTTQVIPQMPVPAIAVPQPTSVIIPSQQSRLIVPEPYYYELNTAISGSLGAVSPVTY